MQKRWTAEEDTFLTEARNKGVPYKKIAEHLGRKYNSVASRCATLGLCQREVVAIAEEERKPYLYEFNSWRNISRRAL